MDEIAWQTAFSLCTRNNDTCSRCCRVFIVVVCMKLPGKLSVHHVPVTTTCSSCWHVVVVVWMKWQQSITMLVLLFTTVTHVSSHHQANWVFIMYP